MITLLFGIALKVSTLIAIALAVSALLRRRSAAVRHAVLAATITCALVLPVVTVAMPQWFVAPRMPAFTTSTDAERPLEDQGVTAVANIASHDSELGLRTSSVGPVLAGIWLGGAGIAALFLVVGLARLRWIALRSTTTREGPWHDELRRILERSRPCNARLLQSPHPALLVTWGFFRPTILLPAIASEWPRDRIRIVLSHELAHIRRRDWAIQMLAEVLRTLHWFNPLVWVVCRRLRESSECACDDCVLAGGVEGSTYAIHLLELARALSTHRTRWSPAPAIARPSHLERRVGAMLDACRDRRPASGSAKAAIALLVIGLSLPIAALAQGTFSTLSGSVFDSMEGLLPNTRVILTNPTTTAKHEVRADSSGRFEFVGLPPGDYLLEARLPGFSVLRGAVTIGGADVQHDIKLEVGSLEETITVVENGTPYVQRPPLARRPLQCSDGPVAGNVGGRIRPPVKLRHVAPDYPSGVPDAKTEEIVRMNARIATDGSVTETELVGPAHPVLAAAAIDAVRQWHFDETLLNCVPVEVAMTVTVMFKKSQR